VSGGIASFKSGEFEGNVTMRSSYSQIGTNSAESVIEIDGTHSELRDVSGIIPYSLDRFEAKSNISKIAGVYGFYTTSISPNKTIINFIGKPAVVSIVFEDNEEKMVTGSNITMTLDNAEIFSRQPFIVVNGISNFSQFYAFGDLYDKVRVLGSDLQIRGESTFNVKYADSSILIEDTSLRGYDSSRDGLYGIVEAVNLLKLDNLLKFETLSGILLLTIFYCLYNFYLLKRK
jgi:hypothetical protein